MANQTSNSNNNSNVVTTKEPPHHLRTFTAAFFGLIALLLIFASILVVWLNQTLTNTQLFVGTMAPLASQPDIQNFIAGKAADQIIGSASTADLAQHFLQPAAAAGKSDADLQAQLRPVIEQSFLQVVQKPAFAALWKTTLTTTHAQFLAQLNSNAPTYTVDLSPTVNALTGQLKGTNLQIIGDQLAPKDGKDMAVTLGGDTLVKMRHYFQLLQEATLGVVAVTLVALAICVLISVHHLKTLRRVLVGTGIISLFVALVTFSGPSLVPAMKDPAMQKVAIAIANTLFHNLQIACLALGIGCLAMAVGSKVYSMVRK